MWLAILFVVVLPVLLVRWWRSGQGLIDFVGLGLVYWYARLWHRWSSNGHAPIPKSGPAILVSNHTCSADPAFLTAGCGRRPSFLIAGEYFKHPLLRRFFGWIRSIPVARNGRDVRAVRETLRRLEEGRLLCIFPEGGLAQARYHGVRSGKSGVALIALKSRVPVYPAAIRGGPQCDDVARAWLFPSPTPAYVAFGPPLDLSRFYDQPLERKLLDEVTQLIMSAIAELLESGDRRPAPLARLAPDSAPDRHRASDAHRSPGNDTIRTAV